MPEGNEEPQANTGARFGSLAARAACRSIFQAVTQLVLIAREQTECVSGRIDLSRSGDGV
jgi:hypothetical protein